MQSPTLTALLGRAITLRRRLEEARRRPDVRATYLLRLQAMQLRLQRRLAVALGVRDPQLALVRAAHPCRHPLSTAAH